MKDNWFEAKIKYFKVSENGKQQKVTESYLLDSMSYTESEARLAKEMELLGIGEFIIMSLKKSNISEVIESNLDSDDKWFKAKISLLSVDEENGREKKSNIYFLVEASNLRVALENLERNLHNEYYEITSLSDTTIIDVYDYVVPEIDDNKEDY